MTVSARITRRRFVAGAGGALALGATAPLLGCGDDAPRRRPGSVVVVGAGLAGLTAAYELQRKGWRVSLVDARERVGGRVRTFRREFEGGQVAEAGGEFIDTPHDAILRYVKAFGLKLEDSQRTAEDLDTAIYLDGALRTRDAVITASVDEEMRRFRVAMNRYARAIDIRDPARTGAGLDTRSVAAVLDDVALDGAAEALVLGGLRARYGAEPDEISLLFAVMLTALDLKLVKKESKRYRIRGGADGLTTAFAERLGRSLALRAPVSAVRDVRAKVQVRAGGELISADYCVVAAPLPALREIEFAPALPRQVRGAIENVAYARIVTTALQYDRRVWAEDGLDGNTQTDLPIGATWDATSGQPGARGILTAHAASEEAAELARLDPRRRIARTAREVAKVYPGSPDELSAAATAAWSRERYSGGAYGAWAPGQLTRYWPALREPAGRIYFAGEHTDVYATYMEGAVRSGKRVAAAIAKRGT